MQNETEEYCTQCGEITIEFKEGYCVDCCDQNQRELDDYNVSYDRWEEMTPRQRDIEINNSIRRA